MFKRLKIKGKLLTGFIIVAILALIIGVFSFFGLAQLDGYVDTMYNAATQDVYNSVKMESVVNAMQSEALLAVSGYPNEGATEALRAEFEECYANYEGSMEEGDATDADMVQRLGNAYQSNLLPSLEGIAAAMAAGDEAALATHFESLLAAVGEIDSVTDEIVEYNLMMSGVTYEESQASKDALTVILTVGGLAAVAVAVILGVVIARMIATPTNRLVEAANQLAAGDVDVDINVHTLDETGTLAEAFRAMAAGIREQSEVLARIADGDYTMAMPVRSEKDVMNKAINHMLDSNNRMISEIREAAEQVALGASQIASGSQTLATGSTEQAATVEELSASVTQVQGQSEDNTELATRTLDETSEAGRLMGESLEYMSQMTEAMNRIESSSQEIAKVIKVIDDIAFQTNILALNAAVEAARAGQHGKGFAVVADEVRNLASKSAAAAKETADLIEHSVASVGQGTEIAERTGESLGKVGEIASNNAVAMGQVSEASSQQSVAISEITTGITQISQVVQANSATAEESAASAQELSAQSTMLSRTVSHFRLREGQGAPQYAPEPVSVSVAPAYDEYALPASANSDVIF